MTRIDSRQFIESFRLAGPYINAHRERTVVISFGGSLIEAPEFPRLIHDIALLHSLGIKVVLVHGTRPQIETRLAAAGVTARYAAGLRITDEACLAVVKEAVGITRIRIEALLSMGLPNSPAHSQRLRVLSPNAVTARPLGVRDGVDYCFTGEVRKIDAHSIRQCLDDQALVLLSPLGYSPTGEVFNLSAEAVASATAAALRADKLLLLNERGGPVQHRGDSLRELSPSDAEHLLTQQPDAATAKVLRQALNACRAGVRRVHLLDWRMDGVLLQELFTRDGVGTLVATDVYESLRPALIDDVGGLIELIRPLEEEGILVRRSRELLENEIGLFSVLERDGTIIGCAALYPFPEEQIGELACVAVHADYRNGGRADALLRNAEQQARKQGLNRLFVLTTRTAHWFIERGFEPAQLTDLPVKKQALYNFQRRSKVFIKFLTNLTS